MNTVAKLMDMVPAEDKVCARCRCDGHANVALFCHRCGFRLGVGTPIDVDGDVVPDQPFSSSVSGCNQIDD